MLKNAFGPGKAACNPMKDNGNEHDINIPKKVIIVDDIYTTGSTIDECSKVLNAMGIEEVYFLTLTIGRGI